MKMLEIFIDLAIIVVSIAAIVCVLKNRKK